MSILLVMISVVLSVALLTLAERKIMASLQRRSGPNVVGFLGILQPFADGIKLVVKENVVPLESSNFLFLLMPFLAFYLALVNWLVLPLADVALSLPVLAGATFLFSPIEF